jgi:AcrR family transcriptional regulator
VASLPRALSLRDLAGRVGMQAPSLYSYFDSKHAIYDAMFLQGNLELLARYEAMPSFDDPVEEFRSNARMFVGFTVEDPARAQLMFMRSIPGFEPSAEAYEVAVRIVELSKQRMAKLGVTKAPDFDLWTSLVSGLSFQQIANWQAAGRASPSDLDRHYLGGGGRRLDPRRCSRRGSGGRQRAMPSSRHGAHGVDRASALEAGCARRPVGLYLGSTADGRRRLGDRRTSPTPAPRRAGRLLAHGAPRGLAQLTDIRSPSQERLAACPCRSSEPGWLLHRHVL